MSIYFKKGKGWRFDFTHKEIRFTAAWFKTKREAKRAEAKKREEVKNPKPKQMMPIDTDFLFLINKRLDYVKTRNSESHFNDVRYHSKRWLKEFENVYCSQLTSDKIENYLIKRAKISNIVANKELQYLRALFNFGIKRKIVTENPTAELSFFPVNKKKKYLPPKSDVLRVISLSDPNTQDYLWTIVLTAGRVSEINALVWDDVDFKQEVLTLYTRKRKDGNLEPRDVPLIGKLAQILHKRHESRDPEKPWVFWHSYWSRKADKHIEGPYKDRKKIMKTLCSKAKVPYFRYHALRHLTASILDDLGIPIGVIQRILGHRNRRTTEIYLHSVGESERSAMNKLSDLDFVSIDISSKAKDSRNGHKEYWLRKVKRPPFNVLKKEIDVLGYLRTGKKYGVSDNTIRKWLKFYKKHFETEI
ncbi:MAG: tyrosine-type recombinase/integrase [Desulfobacterales bacterium]